MRSQECGIYQDKHADKRAKKGKVRAGRCKARTHKRDMQCEHPGKEPDVSLSMSVGMTGHQRNAILEKENSPNERSVEREER